MTGDVVALLYFLLGICVTAWGAKKTAVGLSVAHCVSENLNEWVRREITLSSRTAMSNQRPSGSMRPRQRFVRSSQVFAAVKVSYILKTVVYLTILNLTFVMQMVLSVILSRLLPLQLAFERFQYISLS